MNFGRWIINRMEKLLKLWIFVILLVISGLISIGIRHAHAAALQRGISREVLRFHVLANSDDPMDQNVKLNVRDEILNWLECELTEAEQSDLHRMEQKVEELLPEIERRTEKILKKEGFSYGAEAELSRDYFPEKIYGNCTFPSGRYTALRISLGEARGHNWWCILFPRLCFLDCIHAVLPEESREQLKNVLTEEEYESLFDPSEDEYVISFRYF